MKNTFTIIYLYGYTDILKLTCQQYASLVQTFMKQSINKTFASVVNLKAWNPSLWIWIPGMIWDLKLAINPSRTFGHLQNKQLLYLFLKSNITTYDFFCFRLNKNLKFLDIWLFLITAIIWWKGKYISFQKDNLYFNYIVIGYRY